MATNRTLDLKNTRAYTINDKVREKPIILLSNTDLTTSKKGSARAIQESKCYDFLGTNEYILVPDHDDFTFNTSGQDDPFSVSAWVYMDDATNFRIIGKNLTSGTQEEWLFTTMVSDYLQFLFWDSTAYISSLTDDALTTYQSTWIHTCATYDGSEVSSGIKIYINGIIVDSSDQSSGPYNGMNNLSSPVYIGKHVFSYSNGKMFDVRVHATELSASDVYKVMLGAPSHYEVGWWKCDEGNGVVSYDSSGKSHHGLIKNATLSTFHITDTGLPYSFQNNYGFNIAKLYNSSTTTSTSSTSTTSTSTSTTSTSTSTTSSSTTSTSTSTTSTSTSTSTSTTSSSSSTSSSTTTT